MPAEITDGLDMVQWIQSLGWAFISNCGCTGNYSIYQNNDIKDWQIQINGLKTIFRLHKGINGVDYKKKGQGGPINYRDAYKYWIIDTPSWSDMF